MLLIDLHMNRFRFINMDFDTATGRWLKNYLEAGRAWQIMPGHGVMQESVFFLT